MKFSKPLFVVISFLNTPLIALAQTPGLSDPNNYFAQNSANRMNTFSNYAGFGATAPQTPEVIVANIVKVIIGFIGMLLVILILYGGFLWMTSAGNEQRIDKAKEILKNSIIGLLITMIAYSIAFWVSMWLQQAVG